MFLFLINFYSKCEKNDRVSEGNRHLLGLQPYTNDVREDSSIDNNNLYLINNNNYYYFKLVLLLYA